MVRGAERIGVVGRHGRARRADRRRSGCFLGLLSEYNGIAGILPYYGLFFLLAIPLLGLTPRGLAAVAAAVVVLGPVLLVATADVDSPGSDLDGDPTPGTLLEDPPGVLDPAGRDRRLPGGGLPRLPVRRAGDRAARPRLAPGRVVAARRRCRAGRAAQVVSAVVLYRSGAGRTGTRSWTPTTAAEVARELLWDPDPARPGGTWRCRRRTRTRPSTWCTPSGSADGGARGGAAAQPDPRGRAAAASRSPRPGAWR